MSKIKGKLKYRIIISSVFSMALAFSASSAVASEITVNSVVNLVNKSRSVEKIGKLTVNPNLTAAAEGKAEDIIENDYFAHTSPEGITPWDWFEKYEYDYKFAGENLAISFIDAESQHEAWMESQKHRKNILNPAYQEIGVAVKEGIVGGKEVVIAVQMFGAKESDPVVAQSAGANNNPIQPAVLSSSIASPRDQVPNLVGAKLEPKKNSNVYISALEYENRKFWENLVQISVMFILLLVILINTTILSNIKNQNPFMAVNTVVMMMVLTTLAFWRI